MSWNCLRRGKKAAISAFFSSDMLKSIREIPLKGEIMHSAVFDCTLKLLVHLNLWYESKEQQREITHIMTTVKSSCLNMNLLIEVYIAITGYYWDLMGTFDRNSEMYMSEHYTDQLPISNGHPWSSFQAIYRKPKISLRKIRIFGVFRIFRINFPNFRFGWGGGGGGYGWWYSPLYYLYIVII